jgi:hypothetical protein
MWDLVGPSGGGRIVLKFGGGTFPEGNASSRWLIDIRTDLFQPTTMVAAISSGLEGAKAIRSPNSRA